MPQSEEILIDRITGRAVANIGCEANRQAVERLLLEEKGYAPAEILVDAPICVTIGSDSYSSRIDLLVSLDGGRSAAMIIKCAAGSLDSRQREVLAAARLREETIIPVAVVSNGREALIWDGASGRLLGEGVAAIPDRGALATLRQRPRSVLAAERRQREALIFRSYDSMNVNVRR
jgi:hypothetical protein